MKLTEEQKVILDKVIKGETNIEIGVDIGYSADTVKRQIRKLFKKFRVDKRIDLVREATVLKVKGLL